MELSILYFSGFTGRNLYKLCISVSIFFIPANSADTDEMLPYAAFHLGLHCLPKYLLTGFKNEMVKQSDVVFKKA